MIIENPEALKLWLTSYLPPLCDADPEVLAKYCLALVRKDRPNNELRASMVEQLDVFLKSHTESFVDKFLEVAKSKSYISKVPVTSSTTTTSATGLAIYTQAGNSPDSTTPTSITQSQMPSPTPSSSISTTVSPAEPPLPPLPPLPPPVPVIPHPPPETTPPYPPKKEEVSSSLKSKKPDDKEKDDRRGKPTTRTRGDSRSGSQDKTRSVSRERERNRRSRSRGRSNRSKYEDRRRRSPHMKRFRRSRSRSRSPRWSRSPNRRSRSRDRRSRSRNRSRSASLTKKHLPRHKTRSRSPLISSHPNSPISRLSPSKDDKDKSPSPDTSNEIAAIVHSVVSIPSNQDPYSNTKSQRCRDYDVQGFCMRGDQCPFDHGADRVVLEGGAIEFPPPLQIAPPVTGVRYPVPSSHNSSMPQDIPGRSFLCHPPPMRPSEFGEYTPNNPGLWGGDIMPSNNYFGRGRGMSGPPPQFPGPPPSHPMAPIDRSLINVIPANGLSQAKSGIRPSLAQRLGPAASRPPSLPNYVEGSPTFSGAKYGTSNDHNYTLELRKIPSGMNTITNLNQHFAKFGTIINIQVHHSLDPEAALVTFSSYSEANAAIRSTEAVLNNRFIRLFWHNASKSDAAASTHIDQRAAHDRVIVRNPNKSLINNKAPTSDSVGNSENNEKVVVSRGSLVKTVYNASAMRSTSDSDSIPQDSDPLQPKLQSPSFNSGTRLAQSDIAESNLQPQRKQHLTTVEMKKQEIEAIQRQQELLKAEIEARQKVEKQKSEALKLKNEVELRTRQLLKEQMQHVKLLINKLEKNKAAMKPEEIRTLMETIKSLQAAVENTKAQLVATTVGSSSTTITQIKTKPQLDREILDTELELYTLQTEGRDVSHIKSRLSQLKAHATVLRGKHSKSYLPNAAQMQSSSVVNKSIPYPVVARGRGSPRILRGIRTRGRGRGYGPPLVAVDRRTTCISASGFEREDKEEVMAHFQSLGAVSNYSWDDLTPAICVQYASRKEAEKAIIEGRMLGDRLLNISWVAEPSCFANSSLHLREPASEDSASNMHSKGPGSISARSTTPHSTASVISNEDVEEITEEIVEEVTEEIGSFLYEDEGDDDEEEGGRSWRR